MRHHRAGFDAIHRADLRAKRTTDAERLVDLDLVAALERLVAPAQRGTAEIHAGLAGIAFLGDHPQRRSLDLHRIEDARPISDENRNAAIRDSLAQRLVHGRKIVGIDGTNPRDADRAHQRFVVNLGGVPSP